jgi:hypothetical protein
MIFDPLALIDPAHIGLSYYFPATGE